MKNCIKYISLFLFLIVFVVVSYFFCYVTLVEKAQKQCPLTQQYCNVSSIDYSISKYVTALSLYSEPFVYEQLGLLYFQQEKYGLSYQSILKAIQLANKFPLYEKAKLIITFGSFQPTDWETKQILLYYMLGDLSIKLENYHQCIDDYTKMHDVVLKNNRDAFEKDKRAFCFYKLAKYTEAKEDYLSEKEWLNNRINSLPDNNLKKAYENRITKINEMLSKLQDEQGN